MEAEESRPVEEVNATKECKLTEPKEAKQIKEGEVTEQTETAQSSNGKYGLSFAMHLS